MVIYDELGLKYCLVFVFVSGTIRRPPEICLVLKS